MLFLATLQASNRSPLTRQSQPSPAQPSPLPARTKTSPAGPERQPERHLGFIGEQGGAGRRRRAARCRRAGWRPPKLRCVRRSEGEHAISHSHALDFLVSRGIFAEGLFPRGAPPSAARAGHAREDGHRAGDNLRCASAGSPRRRTRPAMPVVFAATRLGGNRARPRRIRD
jgi:hypothetical protein